MTSISDNYPSENDIVNQLIVEDSSEPKSPPSSTSDGNQGDPAIDQGDPAIDQGDPAIDQGDPAIDQGDSAIDGSVSYHIEASESESESEMSDLAEEILGPFEESAMRRDESAQQEISIAQRAAEMPTALPAPVDQEALAADLFSRTESFYLDGQYLDAYTTSQPLGELRTWTGPEERLLAARLSSCLGAGRVGRALTRIAFRQYPSHPKAILWKASAVLERRGPLAAKEFMESFTDLPDADNATQAEWQAKLARLFACFRDFQRSDQFIDQALKLHPQPERVFVEKANLLFAQDRHEEALQTTLEALELRPNFHVAIQMAAHYHIQLNQDDAALELLHRAILRMQSGYLLVQLADLETELELHNEAYEHLFQANEFLPLIDQDKFETRWLGARQSDAAYHMNEFDTAVEKARECGEGGFYESIANRLSGEERNGDRVMLPVGFVKQHYDTCAPATLTAISQFWNKEVEHLDVVLTICYDGTPSHSERKWAIDQGFDAREFKVTWDSAKALIDRGVPFTLATYGTGMGHLQAVIGYDERRGTILIRDPSNRNTSEFLAKEFFEHAESYGPRGLALVPIEKSDLLHGLELPEADLYDVLYAMEMALQKHDRALAGEIFERIREAHPDHRLVGDGRATLSYYDSDDTESLACTSKLLEKYPKDANLQLRKLSLLGRLGRIQERRALIDELLEQDDCDPMIWIEKCNELSEDARQETQLEELLTKTLRYAPTDASVMSCLANLRWEQQRRDEAFELYRLAACSSDKNEAYAGSYFAAARFLQRTDEATQFLEDRKERFGKQSTWPASTLAQAYEGGGQVPLALQTLEGAMSAHPEDGQFMLRVADMYAEYGQFKRSKEILVAAEPHCHQSNWLRANGMLASHIGQQEAALQLWRLVLASEPLAMDAHQQVAYLLSELKGQDAGIAHVESECKKHPTNYPLGTLRVEWLRDEPEKCEQALLELLRLHPDDPWVHRELGICLNAQRKWREAQQFNESAEKLHPKSPVVHMIKSDTAYGMGKTEQAKGHCREAISICIDYEPAIESLMSMCDSKEERADELGFLLTEMNRQSFQSDALFTFCRYASFILQDVELLEVLQGMVDTRPDQWQVWAALATQLTSMEKHQQAKMVADAMIERFPLFPVAWLYLSRVEAGCDNPEGQIDALERALAINPTWTVAARQLSEVYVTQKQKDKGEALLRNAVTHQPNDPLNLGCLADFLWDDDRHDEAIELVAKAVELEPGYQWAWSALACWGGQEGKPDLAIEKAKELTEKRPNEPRSWFVLAETYTEPHQRIERLAAIDRALDLNPREAEAWSMRAWTLAQSRRFDEALANCRPEVFGDSVPLLLRAAEADMTCRLGESERAIELMNEVLEDDADYYWGWERMFEWQAQLEKHEMCKLAAEQLVRISPKCENAWLCLGDAECMLENNAAAVRHYEKALLLNPECSDAAGAIVATYLQLNNLEASAKALQDGDEHFTECGKIYWNIEFALKRKDTNEVLRLLDEICHTELESNCEIYQAIRPLIREEKGELAYDFLAQVIRDPSVSPHVAHVLVDVAFRNGNLQGLALLMEELDNSSEAWSYLAEHTIGSSSLDADLWKWGESLLDKHRDAVGRHNRSWAAAAYVYEAQGKVKKLEAWMRGWKVRPDLDASMLDPLISRLWLSGREKQAMATLKELHEVAEPTPTTMVWDVFRLFMEGDYASANQILTRVDTCELGNSGSAFYAMLTTATLSALGQIDYSQARDALEQANAERCDEEKYLDKALKVLKRQLKKIHGRTLFGLRRKSTR